MNSIEASIRNTNTKGEVNTLRSKGIVPAIVYGGKNQNQKISVSKKIIKLLLDKENFLSNILTLNIEGNSQNVLPREIKFDTVTDEPIHVDFLRIVKGSKIAFEIFSIIFRNISISYIYKRIFFNCNSSSISTAAIKRNKNIIYNNSPKICLKFKRI